ncbi:serine hydrolase domain-containing protein [Pontibacter sp. G13]|uniref:serine hydrolase domain-containing protein n=1 Tax=Pontibacter sp. G13 TaxID=3074898 RepID=UPI002889A097|nr:serine hydrolase domain-containing protein [Pontibacter sp. G13]WNJ17060.1 serine hydrolase domain-containing protein [Pontibacter sp. G13]
MKAALLCLWIILLIPSGIWAQQSDSLDQELQSLFDASNLPGMAVAVVTESGIAYEAGFGFADVQKETPFTTETLINIGGVSRTVIGLALAEAIERKLVHIDTNINRYLNDLEVIHPRFPKMPITLRQLATHTAGIKETNRALRPTYVFELPPDLAHGEFTLPERQFFKSTLGNYDQSLLTYLQRVFHKDGDLYDPLNFSRSAPGKKFHLSQIGPSLAAYVLECATDRDFIEYVEERVFAPLKLQDMYWSLESLDRSRHATSYTATKQQAIPQYDDMSYPDGGLHTNLHETALLLVEFLKGYQGNGTLLRAETYRRMFAPQFPADSLPEGFGPNIANRAYFWVIQQDGWLTASDRDIGSTVYMSFHPTMNYGKIFITNLGIGDKTPYRDQALKIWSFLDRIPRDAGK